MVLLKVKKRLTLIERRKRKSIQRHQKVGKGHQPKWKVSLGVLSKTCPCFYNVEFSQNQSHLKKRVWLTFPALQSEGSKPQETHAACIARVSCSEQSLAYCRCSLHTCPPAVSTWISPFRLKWQQSSRERKGEVSSIFLLPRDSPGSVSHRHVVCICSLSCGAKVCDHRLEV